MTLMIAFSWLYQKGFVHNMVLHTKKTVSFGATPYGGVTQPKRYWRPMKLMVSKRKRLSPRGRGITSSRMAIIVM
jgi:hypothetical protein